MSLIQPTGYRDPSGKWNNEELAFDGDYDTAPTYEALPANEWSEWLIFDYPRVFAVAVQLHWPIGSITADCEIIAYDGTSQQSWQLLRVVNGLLEWEGSPPYGPVDNVWFRFRHYGEQPEKAGPSEIPLWSICRGPLADICDFLLGVGDFFVDLASDIEELWLVGEFLAAPFEWLGEFFQDGANTCCEASGALQDILDALESGITAESILALIQANWPTLYNLITDPIGWFLVQLTLAFDLEPWHTQSLEFLAKWILEEYFPTLYLIWRDPEGWFASELEDRWPTLYYLVTDPVGQVLYLIGQAFDLTPYEAQSPEFIIKTLFERWFPELYLFARDPETWIRERVLALIQEFTEDIAGFLENAWAWLLDQYEDAFESIQARLYVLAEKTLKFFWEGEF